MDSHPWGPTRYHHDNDRCHPITLRFSHRLGGLRDIDYAKNPRVKALRTLVELGTTVSEAARSIGVSRMTAYRWMDAGRR